MKEMWDKRYNQAEYVYGEDPNAFLEEELKKLDAGTILLPCEGEGRNAVFAAKHNWKVSAFDSSASAKMKAQKLADKSKVSFDFEVADALEIEYPENHFDAIALVYAHFPPEVRKAVHQKVVKWLKPGGRIILEAFSPKQLERTSGGPKNVAFLYDLPTLESDFQGADIRFSEEKLIILNEGEFHKGEADVVRFVAVKK